MKVTVVTVSWMIASENPRMQEWWERLMLHWTDTMPESVKADGGITAIEMVTVMKLPDVEV